MIPVSLQHQHAGHSDCVYTLAAGFAPGRFYSAGAEGIVAEWNAVSGQSLGAVVRVPKPVYALAPHPETGRLVVGQNDGGIHILDALNRQPLRSAQAHTDAVFDALWMPAGQAFAAVGRDGFLSVWRASDMRCTLRVQVSEQGLRCLALSPDAATLAVAGQDGYIRLFGTHSFQLLGQWAAHTGTVFRVVFSPCGRWLLSGGRDAHLRLWAAPNWALAYEVVAHLFPLNDIVFAPPGGTHFATASADKSIKIWSLDPLRLLKVIDRRRHPAHASSVNRLLWLPDPHCLLSASDDRQVLQWQVDVP